MAPFAGAPARATVPASARSRGGAQASHGRLGPARSGTDQADCGLAQRQRGLHRAVETSGRPWRVSPRPKRPLCARDTQIQKTRRSSWPSPASTIVRESSRRPWRPWRLPSSSIQPTTRRPQIVATYYWEKAYRGKSLLPADQLRYVMNGIAATDRALALKPDYVDALTYKNLLLRLRANLETDPVVKQQLIAEADALRNRAIELNKQRNAINGRSARSRSDPCRRHRRRPLHRQTVLHPSPGWRPSALVGTSRRRRK